jgi:hypothetical protein
MKHLFSLLFTFALVFSFMSCESKQTKKKNEKSVFSKLDSINLENNQSIIDSGENITKAYIFLNDSLFDLRADMQKDHRIFGYEKPDIESKKLLLFSIFTTDVENNPFGYELGAYYDMMSSEISIIYQGTDGDFIKTVATNKEGKKTTLYFDKKWIVLQSE